MYTVEPEVTAPVAVSGRFMRYCHIVHPIAACITITESDFACSSRDTTGASAVGPGANSIRITTSDKFAAPLVGKMNCTSGIPAHRKIVSTGLNPDAAESDVRVTSTYMGVWLSVSASQSHHSADRFAFRHSVQLETKHMKQSIGFENKQGRRNTTIKEDTQRFAWVYFYTVGVIVVPSGGTGTPPGTGGSNCTSLSNTTDGAEDVAVELEIVCFVQA